MRALVLAAGHGTRLRPLTTELPKPLLDVGGRPLLGWVIAHVARHGFTEIAVNLHFMGEAIRERIGEGQSLGARITYVDEPELLGTAGAVRNMGWFLTDEGPFLVHYGDVITGHDLGALARFHGERGGAATILVHRRAWSNSVVDVAAEGRVVSFSERPAGDEPVAVGDAWVYSGVCVCSPEVAGLAPEKGDLPRDVFPALAEQGKLYAQPLDGYRIAIDSVERYEQAQQDAKAGLLP